MNYSKWESFSAEDDENDELNSGEALFSQLLSRKHTADALFQEAENDKSSSSVSKYQLAVDSYKDVVHFGYKYCKQGVVSEKWNRLLYTSKLNVSTCLLRCEDFANCVKVCEEAVVMIQQAPHGTIDYQSFLRAKYFLAYAHLKLEKDNVSTVLPIVAEMKNILALEGKFELLPPHRRQYEDLFEEVQRLINAKNSAKDNIIDMSGDDGNNTLQHATVDPVDLLKSASSDGDFPQMLKILRGEKASIVQSLGRGRYLWLMAELALLSNDIESGRRLLDESMQHLANESVSSFAQVTSLARALLLRQRARLECHPSLSVCDLTLAVTYFAQSLSLLEDGLQQGFQVLHAPSADAVLHSFKPSQPQDKDDIQQPQQRMMQLMQFIISPTPPTLIDMFDHYHINIDLILDELRNSRQFIVALVFAKHTVMAYQSMAFHLQEVVRMAAVKLPFTAEAKQQVIVVLHATSQALLRRRAIVAFKFSQLSKLSDREEKETKQEEITDHDNFAPPPLLLDEDAIPKPDALSDLFASIYDTLQTKNSGLPAQIAFQAAKQLFQLKDHHSALSIARSTGDELLASYGIAAFTAMQQTTALTAEQAEMFHDTWRLVAQSVTLDLKLNDRESTCRSRQEIIIALFNAALCAMSGNLMHLAQRALESAEESRRDLELQNLTDKDKAEFKALFGDLSIHLGQVYLRVGRYKDAEEATKDSIAYYGNDHEDDEIIRSRSKQAAGQLAMIYAAWGKPQHAEQALQTMKQTAIGPMENAEEEMSQMRRIIDERQPAAVTESTPVVASPTLRNVNRDGSSRSGSNSNSTVDTVAQRPATRSRTTWQKVGRLFDRWLKRLVESDLADFNMLASYLILLSVVLAIVCVAVRLTQENEEEF